MTDRVKGNIWKLFVVEFTQRRYFVPILAIYFLTLPDATAQQIGLWSGIGFLAEFIFEIPSGYISDRLGHKQMLVISKLLMLASVVCFIIANSIYLFIAGAVFIAISFAAQSGTKTAFLHETLISLKKEKNLVVTGSRIFANARLMSAFLLVLVPLGAQITIRTPLYIGIVIDVIGLIAAFLLVNPKIVEKIKLKRSVLDIMRELKGSGFYPVVMFTSAITGFAIAQIAFMYPYIESLGFPIAYLGLIAGLRALGQFIFGHTIVNFENKINIKRVFLFDLLFFSLGFILLAFMNNVILVAILLILIGSYEVGRRSFIDGYLGKNYVKDKNYMATTLSIVGQMVMLFNFAVAFGIGYVMNYSYKAGFYTMGGVLFLMLLVTYFFVEDKKIVSRVG